MCGISLIQFKNSISDENFFFDSLFNIRHRGYNVEYQCVENVFLGAIRLPINDLENGFQPAINANQSVFAVLNGEIYNYSHLRKLLIGRGKQFYSKCDTELLVYMWEEYGASLIYLLDGMFSFIIYDKETRSIFSARDHLGIKPLYMCNTSRFLMINSELKGFPTPYRKNVTEIPPGCYLHNNRLKRYYTLKGIKNSYSAVLNSSTLRDLVYGSVEKRLNRDLPTAVFFSGGVDSTIILHVAKSLHPDVIPITVGFAGSPDLRQAKLYCKDLNYHHIVYEIDPVEVIRDYEKIIYHLESYEPNLVRGAIFSYYMSKVASENGYKIALSGEGSDEIFCGYKDFDHLQGAEVVNHSYKLTSGLSNTQLMRLDRTSMAHAIEVRVPYLDRCLVEFALGLHWKQKLMNKTNKYILREAFRDFIPADLLFRVKVPMDEGGLVGGKPKLDQLIRSIVSAQSSNLQITEGDIKLTSEEEYCNYDIFQSNHFKTKFNTQRIIVRNF